MNNHQLHLSLNGKWQLWVDPDGEDSIESLSRRPSIEVNVPAPVQALGNELRLYTGPFWYQKEFQLASTWIGEPVYLGFGAVDYMAEIWVNGLRIGDHAGGYLPFEFDISQAIHDGLNKLVVRVTDPPEWFAEIPHGKQSWYGPLSGIWQGVWLERRAHCHISSLTVLPDALSGKVSCRVSLSAPATAATQLAFTLKNPSSTIEKLSSIEVPVGNVSLSCGFQAVEIERWSVSQPNLYVLEVELVRKGKRLDSQCKSFGFRTIEAKDGRLFLNGEMLYLRAALDQDYYPGTICTPPSPAFVEDEMRKAKALGLNCLRIHIKIPDPIYYDTADRIGMLIWTELPNFTLLTSCSAERARQTFQGILSRDGHHPSIIAWTIINEGWGIDVVNDPAHRQWLSDMYSWLKQRDPGRLVVDNSACTPNFHMRSDLDDYHHYRGMPDHQRQWRDFVQSFASRPDWTFSPHGDADRSGQEPLILSEFGNWGLPDANLLKDKNGEDPWWFDTGQDWGESTVYPHGIQSRFINLGFNRLFGSWEKFIEATQWVQFQALKYEIETIRTHEAIQGYVITELTDVHWECNGLMDMDRRLKAFGKRFPEVNADTVVLPEVDRAAWWSDEPIPVKLSISHGVETIYNDCRLRWHAPFWGSEGFLPISEIRSKEIISTGYAVIPASSSCQPSQEEVFFELLDDRGKLLAKNSLRLSLFPRRIPGDFAGIPLWCSETSLAAALEWNGYSIETHPENARVVISRNITPDLLGAVNQGTRLLLLINDVKAFPKQLFGLEAVPREGSLWSGDWVSSFGWLCRQKPFTHLPGGPLLDDSYEPLIPEINLTGFSLADYQSSQMNHPSVLSGQFLGWIHKPSAWIGQRFYGKGKVVLSTFRIDEEKITTNPLAAYLMDALILLAVEENHHFTGTTG